MDGCHLDFDSCVQHCAACTSYAGQRRTGPGATGVTGVFQRRSGVGGGSAADWRELITIDNRSNVHGSFDLLRMSNKTAYIHYMIDGVLARPS